MGMAVGPLRAVERGEELPLSFAQQRLWFLDQLEPGSATYNMAAGMRVRGRLQVAVLEQSLNEIVRRHESLRTSFPAVAGEPRQQIAAAAKATSPLIALIDLSQLASKEQEAQVQHLSRAEAQRAFDLSGGPLLRVRLLRLRPTEHVVLVTMHHIISDGWSMQVLVREVSALYAAYSAGEVSPLAELGVQYGDYAVWQREWLRDEVLEKQLAYWREQLGGELPVLELPASGERGVVQSQRGETVEVQLSEGLSRGLRQLSQREGATLFMTLLACWQLLLSRYGGQEEVVVGTPVAGRQFLETEGLIGLFVNTLVLRGRADSRLSFAEFLRRVRDTVLEAYGHQDVPFEKLVEELQPERSLGHNPLFQTMLVLQNNPIAELTIGGLELEPQPTNTGAARFDLLLNLEENEQGVKGRLEYNADLFEAATIEQLAAHYLNLLEQVAGNASQPLRQLSLLTAAEEQQLLVENNATEVEYREGCIHELFEEQVERTPERVAVVSAGQQVTYGELNRRANQLAHYLRGMGVGAETLVGIGVERTEEMVVGVLGILKAGGAYVPLDPGYPRERLSYMMADAGVEVVVSEEKLKDVVGVGGAQVICLDREWAGIAGGSGRNPDAGVRAGNLAYLIYTSGSTGKPKAVAIEHRNTMSLLHWAGGEFGAAELGGVLASTSLCFDLSVFELFVPLSWGEWWWWRRTRCS